MVGRKRLDTVLPKPPDLWSKSHQHTLLALFFVFSFAWALEQCVYPVLESATSSYGPYSGERVTHFEGACSFHLTFACENSIR